MLISMLFNNTLFVCMLLVCRFCYQHHLVFEREIKLNHDPRPTFSHKKATFYFICCLLSVFNPKNTKYYLLSTNSFLFCKLVSCECLTITAVSWGRKYIYCCRLLEGYREENHLYSLRVWCKPLSHPCRENFSCFIILHLESQRVEF
jgi:hypothetical protein